MRMGRGKALFSRSIASYISNRATIRASMCTGRISSVSKELSPVLQQHIDPPVECLLLFWPRGGRAGEGRVFGGSGVFSRG